MVKPQVLFVRVDGRGASVLCVCRGRRVGPSILVGVDVGLSSLCV